jgi:DeoR family transcriptional regulator of aga operon
MTLRTDLKALDQTRKIVRVHGGAKSVNTVIGTDGLLGLRTARNTEAKELIAQKAVRLLRANTAFYLDSGSTTTALARLVPDDSYLIFTNSISCATELSKLKVPRVTMPGGVLNYYSMSLCGSQSIQAIQKTNFDLMFLGVTSYSDELGFSC